MYKFIIDTNQYAGNFEREMCAFLTGRLGDCEVGSEYAELFEKEVEDSIKFDNITLKSDNGCYRPCEIEPNPNWFNTGVGNHYRYDNIDKEKILQEYAQSVKNYELPYLKQKKLLKERLLKGEKVSNWTVAACDREIAQHSKRIKEANEATTFRQYQAYLSVAIFFKSAPTNKQLDLMKKRAFEFQEAWHNSFDSEWKKNFKLTIEGFRLIKVSKKEV